MLVLWKTGEEVRFSAPLDCLWALRACNLARCPFAFQLRLKLGAGDRNGVPTDHELIRRAQGGDDVAFTRLVQANRKRILGTIARLIGRPEDVEDVGQEVFVRLYFSLDQLRSPEVFEPWLYRLTVNAAYDYLRKQKRRTEARMADLSEQQVVMADAAEGTRVSGDETQQAKTREFVQSLLAEVSEDDRILLTLKEIEGLSLKELEAVYGVNENALKVRLFRARKRVIRAFQRSQKEAVAAKQGGN